MFGHPHPHTHPPLRDSHQIVINIHDTLLTWLDGDGQDDGRLGHRHKHYGCPLSGWAACFDGQEEGIRPSHDDDDDDTTMMMMMMMAMMMMMMMMMMMI